MKGIHGCLTQLVAYLYSFFFKKKKKCIWFLILIFFLVPQSFIIVSDRGFEIIGVLLLDIDQIQLIFSDVYISILRESLTRINHFHSEKNIPNIIMLGLQKKFQILIIIFCPF